MSVLVFQRGRHQEMHHLPIQLCQVKASADGGPSQGCQQPREGEEPFTLATATEGEPTRPHSSQCGIQSNTERQEQAWNVSH